MAEIVGVSGYQITMEETKMSRLYKLLPYLALITFLVGCAKEHVQNAVTAADGGAAATVMSGGNIVIGLIAFLVLLILMNIGG